MTALKVLPATSILNQYFNSGPDKKKAADFVAELRALSVEEKRELATLAAPLIGAQLKDS